MCIIKKKSAHRISVWALVFALLLGVGSSCLLLDAHATSWMDDVGNDARHAADQAGDAVRDAGDATGRAVEDMMDMNVSEGRVLDGDGRIGNEAQENTAARDGGSTSVGWLGWSIAIVVALVVIVLTIILVPKKKER